MCPAAECEREIYARGHCARHYKQLLRHGEVQPDRAALTCAVPSCERAAVTRGWCHGHYLRWSRAGDVQAEVPLERRERQTCTAGSCDRAAESQGLCDAHRKRTASTRGLRPEEPFVVAPGNGYLHHGYWCAQVPPEDRWLVGGATSAPEHRLVMARSLGRPLRADESVHHRNGDRADSRLENLELWSRYQPSGQRVEDKLVFAYELLRRYDREAVSALGLDLDPETGAPLPEEP